MTEKDVFIYSGALLPDGKVYVKVNTKDEARARDTFLTCADEDELYDEALTYAISYAILNEDGTMEVKAKRCDSGSPSQLDSATRSKFKIEADSPICKSLKKTLGSMQVGKQIWIDLPGQPG